MKIALKFSNQEWDLFTYELIKLQYQIKIKDLQKLLSHYKGIVLDQDQLRNLYEACKVSDADTGSIEERLVNVKDLVGTKLNRKYRRIDELIQMQQSEERKVLDKRLLGLSQIDGSYLAKLINKNSNNWN
jgi:hypothetical protein